MDDREMSYISDYRSASAAKQKTLEDMDGREMLYRAHTARTRTRGMAKAQIKVPSVIIQQLGEEQGTLFSEWHGMHANN